MDIPENLISIAETNEFSIIRKLKKEEHITRADIVLPIGETGALLFCKNEDDFVAYGNEQFAINWD